MDQGERMVKWRKAPANLALPPDEIHLWLANIETILLSANTEELSRLECETLIQLKNETFKRRFYASRWITRHILSRYLKTPPAAVDIELSATGKPRVRTSDWEFNRSHSGEYILLAVSSGLAVGADIEQRLPRAKMQEIVLRWFDPKEQKHFAKIPTNERSGYFYECWTAKEAVLKAWGIGLSHLADYAHYESKASFRHFPTAPNYAACVAWTGKNPVKLVFCGY